MTWIWISLAVLVGLVTLPLLVGLFLPREHVARVVRTHPVPPEELWALVGDLERAPEWRAGVTRVERLEPRDGLPCVREHGRFGPLTYVVETSEPPRLLVTRIGEEQKAFGGTWTYELREVEGGTELALTENGFVDNLLFRTLSRFVFGYEGNLRSYQDSLTAHLADRR